MSGHPISADIFRQIVRHTPLVSIDLVITDDTGHVLLGLRTNEPARGVWFVPGGIIRKNETISDAFQRILQAETGRNAAVTDAEFLGVYQHFYDANHFEEPGWGTHYVVLGYRLRVGARPAIALDDQHSRICWMAPTDILASPDVHENTKAYFC
jgi:colanic acid biosynthesis protein WcaH